jgi:hypothetical protein
MPRWASRINLIVKSVQVERLQEITEDDAKSEGVLPPVEPDGSVTCGRRKYQFSKLWDSINGEQAPWKSNPWVFVITFEKIDD